MFYSTLNIGHIRILDQNPENPDMADVQSTIKHDKIDENSKFEKKIEKIDPRASIWHRFHLNSSTSAIFTAV